jgi:hypothetical protein
LQATNAALLEALAARPESAPTLVKAIPALLALLATHTPAWAASDILAARQSAASALLAIVRGIGHADAAPTLRPGARAAAVAPLLTHEGALAMLDAAQSGPSALTGPAAGCLAEACRCEGWSAHALGTEGLLVRCCCRRVDAVRMCDARHCQLRLWLSWGKHSKCGCCCYCVALCCCS